MTSLKDKKVIVGVSGGIAVYKAVELVRLLVRAGIETRVAMTRNATRFVAPLTFAALSGNNVVCDMWEDATLEMEHISWGQESDLVIVAPATANTIAKIANGVADDFLSTMLVAATAPVLVCPSMNAKMLENQAVQDNVALLRKRGFQMMEPGTGQLACRTTGPGRLPEPADIMEYASMLLSGQDLKGLKVMVTAGPTFESIDPVRFIGNWSSGKMGYEIARAASMRGASVVLVSGPVSLDVPVGVEAVMVKSAEQMRDAVFENRKGCDIIIKAAAVSDYRPGRSEDQKIKKSAASITLELVKNPDILKELGRDKGSSLLIGFSAETEDLIENAGDKLKSKNLDMIVANDVSAEDSGFATDTNRVKIIFRDGRIEDVPLMLKSEIADLILERALQLKKREA